jgi:hypothetical protein
MRTFLFLIAGLTLATATLRAEVEPLDKPRVVSDSACEAPVLVTPLREKIRRPRGSVATLNAIATTEGVLYRWKKDGVDLEPADPILQFYRVRSSDAGVYEATLWNPCGTTIVRCTLEVYEAGVLVTQRATGDLGYTLVGESNDTTFAGLFKNEGSLPVRINRIRVFGGDGAYSVLTPYEGHVLDAGESIDVTVHFAPSTTATFQGVLDVDTDSDIDPSIVITGIGTMQEHLEGLSIHAPVHVGRVEPPSMLDTLIEDVVTNTGVVPVTVLRADVTGENAPHFALRDPFTHPVTLQPGESLSLPIIFAPVARGTFRADLDLQIDDRVITIPLAGHGGVLNDGEVVSFGNIPAGSTRDTILTFHHIFDIPLTIREISDIAAPFEVVETYPQLPATLHGWQFLTVRVRFRPTTPGVVASPIRLYWDDEIGNRYTTQRRVLRGGLDPATSVDDEQPRTDADMSVGPLPAENGITIQSAHGIPLRSYDLRDARGRSIRQGMAAGLHVIDLDVADLPSGTYIIHLALASGAVVSKPVVITR